MTVGLGIGVAGYFAARSEPSLAHWAIVCGGIGLSGVLAVVWRGARVVWIGIALILFGFLIAGVRANAVAAPQLGFRYYGPIEGRIVQIDRSQSDAVRLTLDHVVLENLAPDRTPARIRVSLHGNQGWIDSRRLLVRSSRGDSISVSRHGSISWARLATRGRPFWRWMMTRAG
ncbi:MAG: hypothetical protein EBT12_08345 [Marivivens sp.]|nr:hypothetical protein [Marivivens sp.]